MKKSLLVILMAVLIITSVFANGAQEEGVYPSSAVEFVALGNPGGGSDVLARNIVEVINSNDMCPQPVNVINKGGGGGAVGIAYFNQKKDADYGLMTINSTHCLLIHTTDVIPAGAKPWTPIAAVATDQQTLVTRVESPYNSWADVEKAIKENPGSMTIGCCDDIDAMTLNILERETGTQFNHTAYFASSEIFTSLLGGHVDFAIANPSEIVGLLEGGRVKVLGTFSAERISGLFEDIPTFTELGYPGCLVEQMRGVVGPANMSRDVQLYWSDIMEKVCQTEEWQKNYIETNYLTPNFMPADEFTSYLEQHEADLVAFAEQSGMKVTR